MFPSIDRKPLAYDARLWTTDNQPRDQKSMLKSSSSHYQGDNSMQLDASLAQKEEILSSEQPKNKSIALLQDHLKDMTSLVRRLSRSVDRCEAASGMNNSAVATIAARVSTLEGNRTTAELDNKIGRCDIGIREVVREVRDCSRSLLALKQSVDSQAAVELDRQKRSEAKIDELERKLKRYQADTTSEIQILKDVTNKDMMSLGSASHDLERGVSDTIQSFKDQCTHKFQLMLGEVEEKMEGRLEEKGQRLDRVEDQVTSELSLLSTKLADLTSQHTELDTRLSEEVISCAKTSKTSVDRLRGECMSGFRTLQESIDTMHSILDSKICLVEEEIRCEIRKAIKTVVVT